VAYKAVTVFLKRLKLDINKGECILFRAFGVFV